jgi:PPP family 3-phenylpropionic acid transporter
VCASDDGTHLYVNFIYQIVAFKGGNEEATGVASAIAACAEVPVLFLFGRVIGKLRCDQWLKLSCVLLTAKMLLAYFSGNLFLLQSTELLQLGYALFVVSSVYYTGAVIPHRDAISGQAYLNAASTLGVLLSC